MKKIIFEEKNPTVLARDVRSANSYVGLENPHGIRSFLLNSTALNHYSSDLRIISDLGLRNELEESFKDQSYTLYAFDTAFELMRWVYHMDNSE